MGAVAAEKGEADALFPFLEFGADDAADFTGLADVGAAASTDVAAGDFYESDLML